MLDTSSTAGSEEDDDVPARAQRKELEESSENEVEIVEARKASRNRRPQQLVQVFRDEHKFPIAFYFDKSVEPEDIPDLTKMIEKYGGAVVEQENGADTVLVGSECDQIGMERAYHCHPDRNLRRLYVEGTLFIKKCINAGRYRHIRFREGMHGVARGQGRTTYTEEDDFNLCDYLSVFLPTKDMGGRLGLNVYRDLVDLANQMPDQFQWAKRHTAESWKQRYKKNAERFDEKITELAKANPSTEDQLFPYDRRLTKATLKRQKRARQVESEDSSQSEEEMDEDDEENEARKRPSRKRKRSHHMSPRNRPPRRSATQQSAAAKSKGKQRALEEDADDDYNHVHTFENEAGGFTYLDPTLAASNSAHRSEPGPSYLATQSTLVGTAPRFEDSRDTDINERSRLRAPISPRRSGPPRSSENNRPVAESSPPRAILETAHSSGKKHIPKKAARRPPNFARAVVQEVTAAMNRPTPSESMPPPPSQPAVSKRRAELSAETQADEEDVELLLTANTIESAIPSTTSDRDVSISMETDDAEVAHDIRAPFPSSRAETIAATRRTLKRPSEIMKGYIASSNSGGRNSKPIRGQAPTRPAPAQPHSTITELRQRKIVPGSVQRRDAFATPLSSEPRTPATRRRQGSASSLESFPASGTKASDLQRSLHLMEKGTPYNPPAGTRASQLAAR